MIKSTRIFVFVFFIVLFGIPLVVYASDKQENFIRDVEKAFSERQEVLNQYPSEDTMTQEELKDVHEKWVMPEYEMIQEYKDVEFENPKFDQLAHMYMNGVNDQKVAIQYLPSYTALFDKEWGAGYSQRTTSIVAFVDYYGMQIDNDVYLEFVEANNNIGQPQYTITFGDDDISSEQPPETEGDPIGSLNDLFADNAIAEYVREKLGKIDTSQEVTQSELNGITDLSFFSTDDYGLLVSLEGISHLQNLEHLCLYNRCASELTFLPDEVFTLTNLKRLDVNNSGITEIPEGIGNLLNLEELNVSSTGISKLPDQVWNLTKLKSLSFSNTAVSNISENIGNLTDLEILEMSNTEVSSLPDAIGNCSSLKNLNISNTKIAKLPDSIYNLKLDTFETRGLNLSGSDTDENSDNASSRTDESSASNDSIHLDVYPSVKNDVTGKWKLAIISTDYPVSAYLKSYYNKYFKADDEIHAIINKKDSTTACVAVRAGYLNVTIHKYIDGEENDANLLFSGDVISDKWYDKDTCEEVDFEG